jgi:DNA topoisomerase IB
MLGTLESSQTRCFAHRSGPRNKRPPGGRAPLGWCMPPTVRSLTVGYCSAERAAAICRPSDVTRARKQYRFHKELWAARHCAEFDRITAFVTALPALRRRPKRYVSALGLPRENILACVVTLLSNSAMRSGNPWAIAGQLRIDLKIGTQVTYF